MAESAQKYTPERSVEGREAITLALRWDSLLAHTAAGRSWRTRAWARQVATLVSSRVAIHRQHII
jgi:hypothetical protein